MPYTEKARIGQRQIQNQDKFEMLVASLSVSGIDTPAVQGYRLATIIATLPANMRFTQKADALYAILLDMPTSRQITIGEIRTAGPVTANLFGTTGTLNALPTDQGLTITLPGSLPPSPRLRLQNHADAAALRADQPRILDTAYHRKIVKNVTLCITILLFFTFFRNLHYTEGSNQTD